MDSPDYAPPHSQNPYNPTEYPSLPPTNNPYPHPQAQLTQPFIPQGPQHQYPQHFPHPQPHFAQPFPVQPQYNYPQYGQPNQALNDNVSVQNQMAFIQLKELDQTLENPCYFVWFYFVLIATALCFLYCLFLPPYMIAPALIFVGTLLLMFGMKNKNKQHINSTHCFHIFLLVSLALPVALGTFGIFAGASHGGAILCLFLVAGGTPCLLIVIVNLLITKAVLSALRKRERLLAIMGLKLYLNNAGITL